MGLRALRVAPSAGEYVNREIKPHYRYEIEERRRALPARLNGLEIRRDCR